MKTKWVSKVVSGSFALTLILSSAGLVDAKGNDKGKTEVKHQKSVEIIKQTSSKKVVTKKVEQKKVEKKKIEIKSKIGKPIEKRIKSSEKNINTITKSINSYFGVKEDGTTDKELSKSAASHIYNSFKGKLSAEINKLRAIDKQLAAYKRKHKSSSAELDALLAKSKELQQTAAAELKQLKSSIQDATAPKQDDQTTGDDNGTTTSPVDGTITAPGDSTQPSDPSDPVDSTTSDQVPNTQTGDSVQ